MLNISFAKNEDIAIIADFEKNNFFAEAYSVDMLSEMLKDNYILKNNENIFSILYNDDLVGYIIFHISEDFTDIYKIFIRENERNKGYATMLLNKVIELSKRFGSKKIMVEVRSKNISAVKFYCSLDFKEISKRINYYNNPLDDALVLERSI